MAALHELVQENVWQERYKYEDAEQAHHQHLAQQKCGKSKGGCTSCSESCKSTLVKEIAKAREHIQKSLHIDDSATTSFEMTARSDVSLFERIAALEADNLHLRQTSSSLEAAVKRLEVRVGQLEKTCNVSPAVCSAASSTDPAVPLVNGTAAAGESDKAEDDDDFELFGDEEEDEEAERVKQERVKAYEDRKANKPVLIAKSNIILDVKPWDDETDMAELEKCVRSIEMDGLLWGSSKLVPLAYTIKKLQISCVVEDDKVSTEDLEEKIVAFEDYVQSVDIAAFNKI